jgi:hypothetical protein
VTMPASIDSTGTGTDNIPLHLRLLYSLEATIGDPEACRCTLDWELAELLDWFEDGTVSEEEMADLLSENAIETVAMTLQDRRIPSGDIAIIKQGFYIVTNLITSLSPSMKEEQDRLACFFNAMGGLGGFVDLVEHHQNCPICSATILQMLGTLDHWDVIADELFGRDWEELVALVEDILEKHLDTSPGVFKSLMVTLLKFRLLLRSLDRRVAPYVHQSLVDYYMECPLCVLLGQTALEEITGSSLLVEAIAACPCCASEVVTCSAAA